MLGNRTSDNGVDNAQNARRLAAGAKRITGFQGVAVHSGIVQWRYIYMGDDVFSQYLAH